jgi:hypothetical protein
MLDIATRKELAALVYERAEQDTENGQALLLLADDGAEHPGSARGWYDAFLPSRSTLVAFLTGAWH